MKDKRRSFRYQFLENRIAIGVIQDKHEHSLSILNMSKEGCFIPKTENKFKIGSRVILRLQIPELSVLNEFFVPAIVSRVVWSEKQKQPVGTGFEFQLEELDENAVKILHSAMEYYRNKTIIEVSKRILQEFFGKY